MAKLDTETYQQILNIVREEIRAAAVANVTDEIVAGFKAQLDAHIKNIRVEIADIAAAIDKRCNETDDLTSRLMSQIADLEIRLRKYMDGDRYTITKRQVARLMREHNG